MADLPPHASDALPAPARYFPIRNRRYDVAPNLTRLAEAAFGNGTRDNAVFQFDRDFPRYRASKLAARRESFGKYILEDGLTDEVAAAANRRILGLLCAEYSHLFTATPTDASGTSLACQLTGETLLFDSRMRLCNGDAFDYRNAFDALLCQIPEDMAIVVRTPERGDAIAALHLCAPSHWTPADKIGLPFDATHEPVPGMERIRRAASGIVNAMIDGPPTVRFTWGIEFDDRLNHHPEPPLGVSNADWNDRTFDPNREPTPLYLRVERQVTVGLPEVGAALFVIRVYVYDGQEIREDAERRTALAAALRSMSEASREYKSLAGNVEVVAGWLEPAGNG